MYSTVEYGAVGLLNFERNQRGLNTVEFFSSSGSALTRDVF